MWNKYAFWIAVGAACLWTSTHVFAPWLAILQYGTIIVATIIGLIILVTKHTILSIIHAPEKGRRIGLPILLIILGGIIDYFLFYTELIYRLPLMLGLGPVMILLSSIVGRVNIIGGAVIGMLGSVMISIILQEVAPVEIWVAYIVSAIMVSFIFQALPKLSINRAAAKLFLAVSITQLVMIVIVWTYTGIWQLGLTYILNEVLLHTLFTILVTYLIVHLGYWIITKLQANN